jgi:hypothetical protein
VVQVIYFITAQFVVMTESRNFYIYLILADATLLESGVDRLVSMNTAAI